MKPIPPNSNSATMPSRRCPTYKSVPAPGDDSFYPLLLIPYDTMRLAGGYIGSSPFMVKALEDTILKGNEVLVEVNPATAKKLGLSAWEIRHSDHAPVAVPE